MNDQKQQILETIKGAKNVLVTVSTNPSVDQLAAAISLTLILNKLDKHATAVYSGETPSTIEFLKPDSTLEKTTDSLRDFIISLDKAKADKLRYKVEEKVVKIFITPYRTSLTADDLEFSQGDFNVDVVIALGVHFQQDLDSAITAHGRILHDAVVTTINNTPDGDLGSINWQDPIASSLSEQVATLATELGEGLLDEQISTALLTGIVAETGRFRNAKTTPRTMSLSAQLMAAGANQQLIASELEELTEPALAQPAAAPASQEAETDILTPAEAAAGKEEPKSADGTLEIEHDQSAELDDEPGTSPVELVQSPELPEPVQPDQPIEHIQPVEPVDDHEYPEIGDVKAGGMADGNVDGPATNEPEPVHDPNSPKLVTEPPTMGGVLTANSRPEALDPVTDPMSTHNTEAPLLDRSDNPQYPASDKPAIDLSALDDSSNTPPPATDDTSAAASPDPADPVDPSQPSLASLLDSSAGTNSSQPASDPLPAFDPLPPVSTPAPDLEVYEHETLEQIEAQTHQAEQATAGGAAEPPADVDSARMAVEDAIKALPDAGDNGPIAALNAQPFGDELHNPETTPTPDPFAVQPPAGDPLAQLTPPSDQPFVTPVPPSINVPPADLTSPTASPSTDPSAPPPVPPPMMPPGFVNPNQQ